MDAWATLPGGERRSLIRIPDWDMNWQDRYLYAKPFWLPAGTRLSLDVFDNSETNRRNPDRPPARATWGWRSSDEMADLWIPGPQRHDRLARTASVGATSNAGEPPASLITTTYGSAWLRPLNVLQARYVKFGMQLNF